MTEHIPTLIYDPIADQYDAFVRESTIHRVAVPALIACCEPAGGHVLDLGCGQGVLARALAERGDTVTAVDISAALLEIGRRIERDAPRGITYVDCDATTLVDFADGSFDGAATCVTFTDIDDLHGLLASTFRVLKPGGWFGFAALHPCFEPPHARSIETDGRLAKQVNGYFEEGPWRSKNPDSLLGRRHHRTLSTLMNAVIAAGFVVERVEEPRGRGEALALSPIYGEVAEVLVVRAARP
jgi:ubiquinone/menaquinone biosynthesis C-methylase UbiE